MIEALLGFLSLVGLVNVVILFFSYIMRSRRG